MLHFPIRWHQLRSPRGDLSLSPYCCIARGAPARSRTRLAVAIAARSSAGNAAHRWNRPTSWESDNRIIKGRLPSLEPIMFERYTEKARRTVFFARYEAAQVGSAYIESEHILLGLLREDGVLLRRLLPTLSASVVREQLTSRLPRGPSISTSVDLPLSHEAKNILSHAAEEADRLADSYIGTEHLLLALLRDPETYAAQALHQSGARLD